MGAWGAGLYQDDVALDIKDGYVDLLRKGYSKEETIETIMDEYDFYFEDDDDVIPAVLALADTAWKYGRCTEKLKKLALDIIHLDLSQQEWDNVRRRKEVLDKLEKQLTGEQPPEKHVPIKRVYHCKWKIGDTFAYPLESDYAKEHGYDGQYLIITKIGEYDSSEYYRFPIVWIKVTKDKKIPTTEEEINKLDYLPSAYCTYDRYLGLHYPKQPIEVDHNLFHPGKWLVSYQFILENTSDRIIPKSLKKIGNYPNLIPPKKDFLGGIDIQIMRYWKCLERDCIRECEFIKEEGDNVSPSNDIMDVEQWNIKMVRRDLEKKGDKEGLKQLEKMVQFIEEEE